MANKRILPVLLLLLITSAVIGQTSGNIKGKLIDSIAKQSLKDASITLLDPKDSTVELLGLSKTDGSFEMNGVLFGTYLIRISFQGYESVYKHITLAKASPESNLGSIYMKQVVNDLGNVTVTQSPITIKKDTIEYNASSFKTKPNAVVEDLLKKFPGMDVDKSGTIKAQGETVQRVLVDGKRFFGDDPKMATKNLPPDIVDKIQVFDDLSDQSKFTGFDDGNRVKTINITTKKDKRKGYFGKAVAGVGSNETYDENFNIQKMNGDQQVSVMGQGNDINKQNFTVQDFLGGGRGGGRGAGGTSTGSGITSTWAGGLNYRNSLGKTGDITGSYFYNSQRTAGNQNSLTQNILNSDSSTYNNRTSSSNRNNENNRINLNIEDRFDSSNSFVFRPNISFQHTTPVSASYTITTGGTNGKLINRSENNTNGVNSGYNINGTNLQFRHRFKKKGRTISLDVNVSANTNNGEGFNYAINDFYTPFVKTDTINQHYISNSHAFSISPTLSYTEPIARNQMIELNYNHSYSNNVSDNETYRFNNATKGFTSFDSLFSNSYNYTNTSNRATVNYRIQNPKYNFSMGSGIQFTNQSSVNTTKHITVANSFVNFTPTVNFQYIFAKSKNLRINYTGRTGQPTVSQLQPLTTTSDSINFQVGNPSLKPQFTHSLRLLYQSFNPITQHVFLVTINASTIVNDIQSSIIQNPNGGKTSTSVNLDGTYNLSGYINYGFPLKNPKSNLNFTTNINYSQAQTLVNKFSNYTKNTALSQTIKWTTNLKNNFDVNFSATTSYYIARNSLQSTQNANYYTETLGTEITYFSNSGWIVACDFDYTYSGNHAAGYNTSVPLLNPSIAKQFLKNNAGEIRLSVFDLLNQNQSVTRTISGNTIVDQRSTVLTRYAMLTFTYNLRQFAGKQQRMPGLFKGMKRDAGMGGGGMRGGGGRFKN
ncbi:MAG: outer membrane beta-barrel protein [Bacteroidota bacterium]